MTYSSPHNQTGTVSVGLEDHVKSTQELKYFIKTEMTVMVILHQWVKMSNDFQEERNNLRNLVE